MQGTTSCLDLLRIVASFFYSTCVRAICCNCDMQSLNLSFIMWLVHLPFFHCSLSEFSDENMMDPFNLAICLGPTLLPVPAGRDLVQYQGHVTELIKNIIIYQEDIFPRNIDGPVYEKCIIQGNYK